MDLSQQDPQQYPTLKIEGREVEVKLRSYDVIQLQKQGVDIGSRTASLGENLERTFAILHQAIAHAFEDTPDVWPTAEKLSKLDLGSSAHVVKIVQDSISKAMAQWKDLFPTYATENKAPTIQ